MLLTKNNNLVISDLSDLIISKLDSEKILFFIPGGSAKTVAVSVFKKIENLIKPDNFRIILTDERFGSVKHKDSNYWQLFEMGLNNESVFRNVYESSELTESVLNYEKYLKETLEWSTLNIGLFGIGEDGHTAGILPDSIAVNSSEFIIGYQTDNFTRMTITKEVIKLIDHKFVYAIGSSKHSVINKLKNAEFGTSDFPAGFLAENSNLSIYSDIF